MAQLEKAGVLAEMHASAISIAGTPKGKSAASDAEFLEDVKADESEYVLVDKDRVRHMYGVPEKGGFGGI